MFLSFVPFFEPPNSLVDYYFQPLNPASLEFFSLKDKTLIIEGRRISTNFSSSLDLIVLDRALTNNTPIRILH